MQSLGTTKLKKLNPRQGYLAPYIQLPWGFGEDLIGKAIEIFSTEDGFTVKFTGEEFKQSRPLDLEHRSPDIEERLSILERQFQQIASYLISESPIPSVMNIPQNTECNSDESTLLIPARSKLVSHNIRRARGLVGYDVALTRRRSPVRIRPSPFPDSNLVIHSRVSASFTNLTFGFSFPRQWTFGLPALCFPKAILL